MVQHCTSPAQEQVLSWPLPTVDVFYQSFPTHPLAAGLAGKGTVRERTEFPGASVGAAPAHKRGHSWHWVLVAGVCPRSVISVTMTVQVLAECPQGFGGV